MLGLYEERYSGFTVKNFHEQLQKRHQYKPGYTVTRLALQGAGLVQPAPRSSARSSPLMPLEQPLKRICRSPCSTSARPIPRPPFERF
jgi:hypothetical protein